MNLPRRSLLKGAALGALLGALPAGTRLALGATPASSPDVFIFCFLRGAMDGLNFVAPADDAALIAARPDTLRPIATGATPGYALAHGLTAQDWRMHNAAPEFAAIYGAGQLALVHASGVPTQSRSHFQVQDMVERGIIDPSLAGNTGGWIGRLAAAIGVSGEFAVVSGNQTVPTSEAIYTPALSIPATGGFGIGSAAEAQVMKSLYQIATLDPTRPLRVQLGLHGAEIIQASADFTTLNNSFVTPPAYPDGQFGRGLAVMAELIKGGAGLRYGEVELSSWDMHADEAPRFTTMMRNFSQSLGAFWNDIAKSSANVTLVAMSEFGRRIQSNASGGTDHGHGNVMLVLSKAVRGGRIYGKWPGLVTTLAGDLQVTTDSRAVLTEILTARTGPVPATLFPGLTASPALGLFTAS